ncbi:hypothetical protein [Aquiflexum sp.]
MKWVIYGGGDARCERRDITKTSRDEGERMKDEGSTPGASPDTKR